MSERGALETTGAPPSPGRQKELPHSTQAIDSSSSRLQRSPQAFRFSKRLSGVERVRTGTPRRRLFGCAYTMRMVQKSLAREWLIRYAYGIVK